MRNICIGCIAFFVGVALVSCASGNASSKPGDTPGEVSVVEAIKEPKIITIKIFKIVSGTTAYPDGIMSALFTNQYDGTGRLLKEEQFDGSKQLTAQKTYIYKEEKSVDIVTLNGIGEIYGKAVREFEGGKIRKETLFSPNGESQSTEEYTYNSTGQKTKWSVTTESGNQIVSEYTWFGGNLTQVAILDASGNCVKRFERSFNAANSVESETQFNDAGELLGKNVYTYAGKFLVREDSHNAVGAVQSSVVYENDGDGNAVKIQYLDRSGTVIEVKTQIWQAFTFTIQEQ